VNAAWLTPRESLQTVVNRQRGGELPLCPSDIKTFSEQFCQCPITTGCSSVPTFRNNFDPRLVGRYISAVEIAENLVNPAFITITSAEVRGPGVGVGVIDASNSCHMIEDVYAYGEAIVVTTGTVERSRLTANDPGFQSSTDNIARDTFYSVPELIPGSTDCSELYFTFELNSQDIDLQLRVAMQYMFLSEEYPEFVGNQFNDEFKFLLRELGSGNEFVNLARVKSSTGQEIDVSVNSVNYESLSAIFRLCTANTYYDGNTVNLFSLPETLTVGKTYEVRLIVCDVGDTQYDSAVFIKKGSLAVCDSLTPEIVCPSGAVEVCPNAEIPSAFSQGSCLIDYNVVLEPGLNVGTSEVGTYPVTYILQEAPEVACSFDMIVANRAPLIYNLPGSNLLTYSGGEVWNGEGTAPRKAEIGEKLTLSFTLEDDCCESGNNAKVFVDAVQVDSFVWNSEDLYSKEIEITSAFGLEATIKIVVEDCYGIVTTMEIAVPINGNCNGIGSPQVFISGGSLTNPYVIGDQITFLLSLPESNTVWYVSANGNVVQNGMGGGRALVNYIVESCGTTELIIGFENLCNGIPITKSYLIEATCAQEPTDAPTEAPTDTLAPSPSPSPCEPGFKKNPISSECEKTCSSDSECVSEGVCSGECLSSGFCKDGQGTCRLGCCKATPGNIPLTVSKAICSNGCGANSCCFENIADGCNAMNAPAELEETCTALYGKKIACTPESESIDCSGHGIERCIQVKNGKINDSYCSASCTSTKPCSSGYKCVQFTKSYTSTPAIYGGSQMSFCVPNALTA